MKTTKADRQIKEMEATGATRIHGVVDVEAEEDAEITEDREEDNATKKGRRRQHNRSTKIQQGNGSATNADNQDM